MSHPLESVLEYRFQDARLLRQALTHSTYANEHPEQGPNNERLEFLGDAVVDLLVAARLFGDTALEEGAMTKQRARVVRREGLAELARQVGLGEHVLLGAGQRRSGGEQSDRVLADAFEALVGAVFLDGGWVEVERIFSAVFDEAIRASQSLQDFKTALQEHAHATGRGAPEYRILTVSGPDHARRYEVEVLIDGDACGVGAGRSKKTAEQDAARSVLEGES